MKTILLAILFSFSAYGAPILNLNMAAEGTFVTIWPDHEEPDHFYFAPNAMKMAVINNAPKFYFTEYSTGLCDRPRHVRRGYCHEKAMLGSLLVAAYEEEQLATAQKGILRLRPNARFSPIPFLSSKTEFTSSMSSFLDDHDCDPKAGQAADEVPCTLILNRRGINTLKPYFAEGKILPFKFIYRIAGVIEGANGQFKDEELEFGLAVSLGGEILMDHPDLQ